MQRILVAAILCLSWLPTRADSLASTQGFSRAREARLVATTFRDESFLLGHLKLCIGARKALRRTNSSDCRPLLQTLATRVPDEPFLLVAGS